MHRPLSTPPPPSTSQAPLLSDLNRTYATFIELNLTRSRNNLIEVKTRLLLAESGSFQDVIDDLDGEVANLIFAYFIYVGFVVGVGLSCPPPRACTAYPRTHAHTPLLLPLKKRTRFAEN